MNFINLNGKIISAAEAGIPVDNGAFRYGYGLYETMLVEHGIISLRESHLERLFTGLKQLCFDVPQLITEDWFEHEVLRTVKKNKLEKLCRVRLQLFANGGGLYSSANNEPGYMIECFPLEAESVMLNEDGLTVGVATGLNKSMDSLSNLKSCNALIYAIAAQQARENKWNDALVCNTNGNIIESTIANIFWIKNDTVFTPPLTDGCVAGVMRRHIIERIPVIEKSMSVDELPDADEVFLTNAVKKIRWISAVGSEIYKNIRTKDVYKALFL